MKNSRMKIAAVLLTTAFALTGCGEAMYDLTTEEQNVVVNYAAQAVAKFNTYQQDGEVFIRKDLLDGETEEEIETDIGEEVSEDVSEGTEEIVEMTGTEQEALSEMPGEPQSPAGEQATMTEALDLGVIRADYAGHELTKTYHEQDFYAVDADNGKQFLVVKYDLVNTSAQSLHIDILAMTPTFGAVVNEEYSVSAETTILLNDLSTYQADIEPEATNNAVILFEIPEEIESVDSLQLNVTMNGIDYTINL